MNFNERVWDATKQVPKGKVTTYGNIATVLGTRAYRAVGTALAKNPFPITVPCHRVVRADGEIGGFCGAKRDIEKKKKLLESEGIQFEQKSGRLYVKDFKKKVFGF